MNIYNYVIAGMSASFILTISIFIFYFRYKKNLIQHQYLLKESEISHQKALLSAIIFSQEEERKRIGMDLHDEVGANLASLRLMIENFVENKEQLNAIQQFNIKCKNLIDNIIINTRNISHNLSPMFNHAYGFKDMIYDYCENINNSGRISINITSPENDMKLNELTALALYRVITELINNTIKHANAKQVLLSLIHHESFYQINYQDDGIGLVVDQKNGMGLKNIESRLNMINAVYHIKNINGFNISITLPFN
jgi:signal transduction histidine kinase